jgi:hypothetical protein
MKRVNRRLLVSVGLILILLCAVAVLEGERLSRNVGTPVGSATADSHDGQVVRNPQVRQLPEIMLPDEVTEQQRKMILQLLLELDEEADRFKNERPPVYDIDDETLQSIGETT